jgi:3-deoxy-D-manno-octulosonic-acid transferase
MYNALVEAGGARLVESNELAGALDELLSSPETLTDMGKKAHDFVVTHRGAVQETLRFIDPPLPNK